MGSDFSRFTWPNHSILRVGRHATLDKSNPKECKVVVKNAGDQDDGTWHFQVGYGDNREEMQWYQHSVVVQVKSKLNFQNLCKHLLRSLV